MRARLLVPLLVLVVAGGLAEWRFGWYAEYVAPRIESVLGEGDADNPAEVAPPPGLELPPVAAPAPVGRAVRAGRLDVADVRTALAPHLRKKALGRHVVAAVAPLDAGAGPTFTHGSGLALPASTTKLVTAAAGLLALGPERRFDTRVVMGGQRRVVLVGGGDPFLLSRPADSDTPYPGRADVVTLAKRTAQALRKQGVRLVRVGYDDSLFSGPAEEPTWEADYIRDDVVAPISALWTDRGDDTSGWGNVADPAATAAAQFAQALGRAGIRVNGAPQRGVAGPAGTTLASVKSAPLSQIVERLIDVSDNEATEVLLRHLGLAVSGDASFAGGAAAREQVLRQAGVNLGASTLYDGSGLSRANRIEPQALIDVLRLAASPSHPELRPVFTGLPVFGGFHGSLADDYHGVSPEAQGRMRAKTGTLTGVHALAGMAVGPDGIPMVFVLVSDKVKKLNNGIAPVIIADAAAALGACSCGA